MKKESNSWMGGVVLLVLLIIAVSVFSDLQDAAAYDRGHAALLAQDCTTAVAEFDRVINAPRVIDVRGFAYLSKLEKGQCELFEQGIASERGGAVGEAAGAYYALMRSYNQSPLYPLAKERAGALVNQYRPEALANERFCAEINGNADAAAITEPLPVEESPNYPRIVDACAKMYQARSDWKSAVRMYTAYLRSHSTGEWPDYFRGQMANAMLNEVAGRNPGQLAAPVYTGQARGRKMVLNFFNDSPDNVQVTINGPATRTFELEACDGCAVTGAPEPGPCQKKGPSISYELPEGAYHIIVETSKDGSGRPYTGYWSFGVGQFDSCYSR